MAKGHTATASAKAWPQTRVCAPGKAQCFHVTSCLSQQAEDRRHSWSGPHRGAGLCREGLPSLRRLTCVISPIIVILLFPGSPSPFCSGCTLDSRSFFREPSYLSAKATTVSSQGSGAMVFPALQQRLLPGRQHQGP